MESDKTRDVETQEPWKKWNYTRNGATTAVLHVDRARGNKMVQYNTLCWILA